MKPLHALVFVALLPLIAVAEATEEGPAPFGPLPATEVAFDEQLYVRRPLVVFADSPNDPNFVRQMDLLSRSYADLEERDVILVIDTDPAARSEWRQKLRPRGFSLVIMDKDLRPVIRKPLPWDLREITHAIDRLPLRRQEILERNPAGR
ncbi:DUF4174 domain-containing protein [Tabrizicola caldifontis]|uniref:DUF4174 domain-containing protein n=1 Tax=Tabrizicola caldifontis TaxID=2528036 RepID=UPI0010819835|nr:DUF4174 domain-containing protein [Rhodobacter sp. YIM 73028]